MSMGKSHQDIIVLKARTLTMAAGATIQGFSLGRYCRRWVWRLFMGCRAPWPQGGHHTVHSTHHITQPTLHAVTQRHRPGRGGHHESPISGMGLQFAGWVSPWVRFMTVGSSSWSCQCGQDRAKMGVAYLGVLRVYWAGSRVVNG